MNKVRRYVRPVPNIGWKPALDEDGCPALYHAALEANLEQARSNTGVETEVEANTCMTALNDGIVSAAALGRESLERTKRKHSEYLQNLLQQRRACKDKSQRAELSKLIFLEFRTEAASRQEERLDAVIAEGRGKKAMETALQKGHKKKWTTVVKDSGGSLHFPRDEISEVFAHFYETLYGHMETVGSFAKTVGTAAHTTATVDANEVKKACEKLQHKKTCADDGLVAEMLQTDFEPLLQAIAEAFTDILNGSTIPPKVVAGNASDSVLQKRGPQVTSKLPTNCSVAGDVQAFCYSAPWPCKGHAR